MTARLTADEKRHRALRKQTEADRADWLKVGGQIEWQRQLNRRRAARNERTRQRTVGAATRHREPEQLELGDAS